MAFTNLCATVTPCPCPWPWPSYSRIPSWISFYFYHSSYSCCHLVVQPTKATINQSYYCCHSYSSCCNSYAYLLLTFTWHCYHCYYRDFIWLLLPATHCCYLVLPQSLPHPPESPITITITITILNCSCINPQPISHHQYQYQALDLRFCISIHTTPSCPLSTLIVTHHGTVVIHCRDWGLINHCYWWEWEWVLVSEEAPLPPRMHTEHSFPLLELELQLSWLQPPAT